MKPSRLPVLLATALVMLLPAIGCDNLKARDQLNKGVQAYKAGRFEEAIGHFQTAVTLDPKLPSAKLYLATAYMQQVIPNLKTPENEKNAQKAIDSFQSVLEEKPNDSTALKGIASIYFNLQQDEKSKEYQKKVLAVDPKDAEAYYSIGAIDWRQAYNNAVKILTSANMQDKGDGNPGMPKPACQSMIAINTPIVTEGLDALEKAVQVRQNYDDAMAYLNLLYRRKADLECGNDAARKEDVAQADQWVQKAMNAKKAREEEEAKHAGGGIVIEQGR